MTFRLKMEESEKRKGSKIILALDQVPCIHGNLLSRSLRILEHVNPYICAVKLNMHIVLPLGLFNGAEKIVREAQSLHLPVIMDCKINDIGYTNRIIAENYFKAGFDAVIANPFVGWEEGLQPVFEIASQMNRGVLLLIYMSHKATLEGYGQKVYDQQTQKFRHQYLIFAEKALFWKADGAIVGATYTEKIREIYKILKDKVPIYSPGVGIQGGDMRAAVDAGSHYIIVGRTITLAENPEESAKLIRDVANYKEA